jgi:hypothetical protein
MAERPTALAEFHKRVEAYLSRTGMKPSLFGLLACKDQSFVSDLGNGREPKLSTIERVDQFMRDHPDGAGWPDGNGSGSTPESGREGCSCL